MPAQHVYSLATAMLGLTILTLPFARHWLYLDRPTYENYYYEFTSPILYLSDIAVLGFLAMVALWGWQARPAHRWGPWVVTLPLLLLPLRALVTAPWAADPVFASYLGGRLLILFALYQAIVLLQPPPHLIQRSLGLSLGLQAIIASLQFVRQTDLGWHWLGEIDLHPFSGYASVIQVGEQVWLRGYGLTPHPNILGGILATWLLALVIPFLESSGRIRGGWFALLGLGSAGLVVSFSRAAWLGTVAGGLALLGGIATHPTWRRRYGRTILIPAIAVVIILAGFVLIRRDLFLARLRLTPVSHTEARSLDERRVLTQQSLVLIRHFPLAGVGAGSFSTAVAPLVKGMPLVTPQPVHNLPLLLSAELGVFGGGLWIWLMLAPLILAWRRLRAGSLSLWGWGITAGLVVLAVTDLFDFYSWGWPQGRLLRWIQLGLWSATPGIASSPSTSTIDS